MNEFEQRANRAVEHYRAIHLTNADRLTSKTPEELAELFSHLCCPYTLGGNVNCNAKSKGCYECWLDWLNAPADEEGEG